MYLHQNLTNTKKKVFIAQMSIDAGIGEKLKPNFTLPQERRCSREQTKYIKSLFFSLFFKLLGLIFGPILDV